MAKLRKFMFGGDERSREETLADLIESLPCGILCCRNEPDFGLLSVNPGFLELFGYTRDELATLCEDRYIALVHPEDKGILHALLNEPDGMTAELEYRVLRKDGAERRILDQSRAVTEPDGTRTLYCVLTDITRRKQDQEVLRIAAERMQVVMDQANDILFEWDFVSDTIQFSSNWKKRFGYAPIASEPATRLKASFHIHPDDHEIYAELIRCIRSGRPYTEAEYRILSLADKFVWYRARATVQFDDCKKPIKAVGILIDIDAEKRREEKLLEQARRDALTDLYNKKAARTQVEKLMESWEPGTVQALMIIDLDDFKRINDRYGHMCGDAVLTDLAACLKKLFRASDGVGRIGGDEFLAYVPGLSDREVAESKARAILSALAEIPLHEGGRKGISCSIGIAFYPDDGVEYAQLYRCADRALYHAKSRGKSGYAVYSGAADMELAGRNIQCISTSLDLDQGEENATDVQLSQYAFQLLYSSVSTEAAIRQILELAGRTYDVSRVYICETSDDGLWCSSTFEWCNEGLEPQRDQRQNLPMRCGNNSYLQCFDDQGVFYCAEIERLPPLIRDRMKKQKIASVLQCAIREDGRFCGFIGFDECRTGRAWTKEQIRSLTLVANVLSTFLLKLRFKERIAELERQEE